MEDLIKLFYIGADGRTYDELDALEQANDVHARETNPFLGKDGQIYFDATALFRANFEHACQINSLIGRDGRTYTDLNMYFKAESDWHDEYNRPAGSGIQFHLEH